MNPSASKLSLLLATFYLKKGLVGPNDLLYTSLNLSCTHSSHLHTHMFPFLSTLVLYLSFYDSLIPPSKADGCGFGLTSTEEEWLIWKIPTGEIIENRKHYLRASKAMRITCQRFCTQQCQISRPLFYDDVYNQSMRFLNTNNWKIWYKGSPEFSLLVRVGILSQQILCLK